MWNKDIELTKLKELYLEELDEVKENIDYEYALKWNYARYCYLSILLTQLFNGGRVSEATEAIKRFYDTGDRLQVVRVRKTKKGKPKKHRTMVIPPMIERNYLQHIDNCFKDPADYNSVKQKNISTWVIQYMKRKRGVELNTHTNRYAYITHMILVENINPVELQQITKHTDLNMITKYTSEKQATDTLSKTIQKWVEK